MITRKTLRGSTKSNQGLRLRRRGDLLRVIAAAMATSAMASPGAYAVSGTWAVDADGNWSDSGNWSGGTVADGVDSTASFTIDNTATRTVTLDTNRTVGNMTFNDGGGNPVSPWVITGANPLTLDVTSGAPTITVSSASRAIINSVLAGNDGLTKVNSGLLTLTASNTYSGTTTINTSGGSIQAIDGVGLPSGSNLNFNGSFLSGTFLTSGVFNRALGTGAGEVQWTNSGGFGAIGGPLVVQLGGNTNTVTWGSGYFVMTGVLNLSSIYADNVVDFQNDIDLGATTRFIHVLGNSLSSTDFAQISGAISGAAGSILMKRNNGTLILTGANSYDATQLNSGTVQVGNGGTTGTLGTGRVEFGTGTSLVFNRSNALTVNNTMQPAGAGATGTIIQDGTGTTTLAGDGSTYLGALTVRRGTLVLDYGPFDTSKVGNGTFSGFFTIGSAALQLANGTHQEVVGATTIDGAATISRNSGSATLRLNAITVNPGASLDISIDNLADTDTLNSNGVLPGVTVGGQLAKNFTNAADGQIRALVAADYTDVTRLGGTIADGAATNVKIVDGGASGPVTLGSATTTINTISQNATAGPVTIALGSNEILRLGPSGTILVPTGAGTLTIGGGKLTAGGADDTAGTLTVNNTIATTINSNITDNGTGAVSLIKTNVGTLTLGGNNSYTGTTAIGAGTLNFDLAGTSTLSGNISGGGSITKNGAGSVILTGNNNYSGGTTIFAGTLLANNSDGSATGSGGVTVKNGATLGGTGAISGPVTIEAGGTFSPGASIEDLSVGGILLNETSHFLEEIDVDVTPDADLTNVTGVVNLGGAILDLSLFNTTDPTGFPKTFLIVQNDLADAVGGTFGSVIFPEGAFGSVNTAFAGTDILGRIGDGNDIAVTISAIPEPASLGLLAIGGTIMLRRRR